MFERLGEKLKRSSSKGKEDFSRTRSESGSLTPNGTMDSPTKELLRKPSIPITFSSRSQNPDENYKQIQLLGEGAFGACYLVEDVNDSAAYVLKRMKCQDKEEMLEALKEMVMMRICVSPFVVKFKEFYKDDQKLEVCLVMEFCEEGDLYHRLKDAYDNKVKLPEKQILRWFTQILLGLEAIHAKQFVHRDLKPGNIFLSRWDVVKLGDFGLGVFLQRDGNSDPQDDEVAGTPGFIAPEILINLPYDAKSDVYALGCCLYEMLTLRSAYYDTKNDYFPQPLPDGYSEEIGPLLLKLLTPDPMYRPSVQEILQDPLIKDLADPMRHEQELLQRVVDLEKRIGYKHHERRKHAAKSYLSSLLKDSSLTIADVENEWNSMVMAAQHSRGGDAAAAAATSSASSPGVSPKGSVIMSLRKQISNRQIQVDQLARRVNHRRTSSGGTKDDTHAQVLQMEEELEQLRSRNSLFEMMLDDMAQRGTGGDADRPSLDRLPSRDSDGASSGGGGGGASADTGIAKLQTLETELRERRASQMMLEQKNRDLEDELARTRAASGSGTGDGGGGGSGGASGGGGGDTVSAAIEGETKSSDKEASFRDSCARTFAGCVLC